MFTNGVVWYLDLVSQNRGWLIPVTGLFDQVWARSIDPTGGVAIVRNILFSRHATPFRQNNLGDLLPSQFSPCLFPSMTMDPSPASLRVTPSLGLQGTTFRLRLAGG